eukprot:1113978-Karenia_brevis.AAC.1
MGHMLRDRSRDAVTCSTLNIDGTPNLPTKLRVGRPRLNWYKETSKRIWNKHKHLSGYAQGTAYNHKNPLHRHAIL